MAEKLKRPVFDGGPNDTLVVADVYNSVSNDVKNNFTSSYSAFSQSLTDTISSQRKGLASLYEDVSNGEVGLKTGLQRAVDLLKGARGAVNDLSTNFKARIEEITNDAPMDTYRMVKANIDGVYRTIRTADLKSVGGITALVNDLAGENLFSHLDMGAEVALLTGILEEIDKWEIPEFVDEVMAFFNKDKGKETVWLATANSASHLSLNADIDVIEQMLKHTDPAALTRDVPDFAQRLLMRYVIKPDEGPEDYPHRLEQLIRVLDQLQPNWLYLPRENTMVFNLSILQQASPHAKLLLSTHDTYRLPVLAAPSFRPESAKGILGAMYPLVHFGA